MAPIFSKFIKLKSGYKIPINESNVKAIVKLTKIEQKSRKLPVKYVPRPGLDRDISPENDPELNQLLEEARENAEIRRSARVISESDQNASEVRQNPSEIDQNRPDYDQNQSDNGPNRPNNGPNRPNNGQNRPDNGHNQVENDQNDPTDDFDELLEPNLELSDITLAQRAELLLFPGTDKCKRRQFYLKYYPNFYHYYESLECWDECPLKSKKFTFHMCPINVSIPAFFIG